MSRATAGLPGIAVSASNTDTSPHKSAAVGEPDMIATACYRCPGLGAAQAVLRVPTPPSANNLFTNAVSGRAHGAGRVKGKKYRAWLHEAGWEIKRALPPYFTSPVAVLIECDLPRQRDVDNAIKPLLDLLVYVQVLKDDSLVDDLRIVRRGEAKVATISLWPLAVAKTQTTPRPSSETIMAL